MAEITKFYAKDAADNIDNVLEQAIGVYDRAVIIGYDKNGVIDIRSNTAITDSEIVWLIEVFKMKHLYYKCFEVLLNFSKLDTVKNIK